MEEVKKALQKLATPKKAKSSAWFFKTAPGQYAEGDIFIGITVPEQRKVALRFMDLPVKEIGKLLADPIHECRLTALMLLVYKFKKAPDKMRKDIYDLYLKNTKHINNWDLVDTSAAGIVGNYLVDKDRSVLYTLAQSDVIWERRIAMIATFAFIRNNDFEDTKNIADILIDDKHDLIQKAVGWMLREMWKKDQKVEEDFLLRHYKVMPRTMLRYAIEKFDEKKRRFYMGKN